MTTIGRALWNVLRPQGDPVDCTVTVRPAGVDIEADGVLVSAAVQEDGVDVRVGSLEVFVKGGHVTVVQAHPPYPIERWTVLWEGDLA